MWRGILEPHVDSALTSFSRDAPCLQQWAPDVEYLFMKQPAEQRSARSEGAKCVRRDVNTQWEELRSRYSHELRQSGQADMTRSLFDSSLTRNRYVGTLTWVERELGFTGKRVLDVAARPFVLDCLLTRLFGLASLVATDLSPADLSVCLSRIAPMMTLFEWDLDADSVPSSVRDAGPFDIILFLEIFEHLRWNPIKTMQNVLSLLAPGGKVVITVPNMYYFRWFARILLGHGLIDHYKAYKWLEHLDFPGHVRMPSILEMRKFVAGLGASVEGTVRLIGDQFEKTRGRYAFRSSHVGFILSYAPDVPSID